MISALLLAIEQLVCVCDECIFELTSTHTLKSGYGLERPLTQTKVTNPVSESHINCRHIKSSSANIHLKYLPFGVEHRYNDL